MAAYLARAPAGIRLKFFGPRGKYKILYVGETGRSYRFSSTNDATVRADRLLFWLMPTRF